MNVGVTGHQRLDNVLDWEWVRSGIKEFLMRAPAPIVGISCLAVGADQLFAETVLQSQGSLHAIIPFPDYDERLPDASREDYKRLLARASSVDVLARSGSDEECYYAAGKKVVDNSDVLIAVWNGEPAQGLGGTADVVRYAQDRRKTVVHLNPDSKQITTLD
jgi:hypothetical protein